MAWALQFDGVSAYTGISAAYEINIGDVISYTGVFEDSGQSFQMFLDFYSGSGNYVAFRSGGETLDSRISGSTKSAIVSMVDGDEFVYTLERTSTQYVHTLNGVELFRHDVSTVIDLFGFSDPTFRFKGQLIRCTATSGTLIHDWDATASDHSAGSQPILTDTIGGNDAQGFNFPTDGSAWVDLGGGAQESSVNFSVNKPVFATSIENINTGNQTTANFSVNKPLFSASIDNEAINNQVSVNYSTSKPIFFAAIENEQVNNSSDVDFTLNKPSFNAQINNSAGTNVSDIDFSINKPVFNIAVENESPANITNVNFAVSKLLFSASVLNTNPPNELAVNFAIDKPVFSVNIQNGDIVVKFNEETNYSQEYLSTNYDQPYLSTNYTQD